MFTMRATRSRRDPLVAIGLLCSGLVVVAQEPTFKAGNRTVAVYATVTNAQGRLVADLPRETFTVLDNGKAQPVTLFANDVQPITVVMLIDRSGSMRANFDLVEKAAESFVDDLLPGDKARIGSFATRIQVDPRDFSADREELRAILRTELQPEGPTPLWNAINVGITALLHQDGRRVILVFTDGVDNPANYAVNNSLRDVMKRADEEDIMVYAIGLAGQNGPPTRGPSGVGNPGGGFGRGGRGGFGRGGFGRGGPGGNGGSQRAAAVDEKPDEGLPKIATATGGGYFELTSTNDMASTFKLVADELHHQYALGFTPTSLDGKVHALSLHANGAGLAVRARKSYLARATRS